MSGSFISLRTIARLSGFILHAFTVLLMAPSVPETMKAMVYDKSGPNRMAWHSDYKVPSPGRQEVLVKIASSSLNPIDYRLTDQKGWITSPLPHRIVGCDFAGTIVGLGRDVRGFVIGDQVFGWGAGYANYCTANVNEIARVPPGHGVEDMGIYGLVGTCAHQILRKHWLEKPDFNIRNLLIIGASGGVGSSLVQIARAYGGPELKIHTITSLKNSDYVRSLGADDSVDYAVRDFDIARTYPIHSMDLIIDTVSGSPEGTDYYRNGGKLLLRPQGNFIVLNSMSSLDRVRKGLSNMFRFNLQRSHFDFFVTQQKNSDVDLQAVARLIQQDKYKLNVAQEIPLIETPVRGALHELRLRHVRGKIKIRPTEFPVQEPTAFESAASTPRPIDIPEETASRPTISVP